MHGGDLNELDLVEEELDDVLEGLQLLEDNKDYTV